MAFYPTAHRGTRPLPCPPPPPPISTLQLTETPPPLFGSRHDKQNKSLTRRKTRGRVQNMRKGEKESKIAPVLAKEGGGIVNGNRTRDCK